MPIPFLILKKHDLIVARPLGKVCVSCVLTYFDLVRAHADYRLGLDRLIDNRDLVELDIDFDGMRNLRANETRKILAAPNRVKSAFVCIRGKGFGLARMYQTLVEVNDDHDVGVFETYAEAVAFLGRDPALAERLSAWR